MLQCPYFFFDVIYIHNGAEEKEEDLRWKVRRELCLRRVQNKAKTLNPACHSGQGWSCPPVSCFAQASCHEPASLLAPTLCMRD